MDRLAKIRYRLDPFMRGLEIGPSYNPCMPKADGWAVETVDHLSREQLVEKFVSFDQALPIEKIEDVDWIWKGELLDELIGAERFATYDYIVASHVIEHIPDLLGFFKSAERLLKDGGVLSLVVPDKRHCFDFFKPLTLTPDLLDAHKNRRRRHSSTTAAQWFAYSTLRDERSDWDSTSRGDFRFVSTLAQAMHATAAYDAEEDRYLDCHAWYFVPSSFLLVIEELRALGHIRLDVAQTFEPAGCEFYVHLRKAAAGEAPRYTEAQLEQRRVRLLKAALHEMSLPTLTEVDASR